MNDISGIQAINSWAQSEACRQIRDSAAKQGTPYDDPRASQPFTLDGNFKVYPDGYREPISE